MHKYSLDDFSQIMFSGFSYVMPEHNKTIIQNLLSELNINANGASNNFTENKHAHIKKNAPNRRVVKSEENWEKVKQFQTTKIEKKEGVDKFINDIRCCLNKLSSKNYDIQFESIYKCIDQIMSEYSDVDDKTEYHEVMTKIAKSIFDIASTNKFYSELYAKLYNDLIKKYVEFNSMVDSVINQYYESVSQIAFVDEKTDYDKFCDNNKVNDKRKAIVAFIVNLMKCGVINNDNVLNCIIKLQDTVLEYINESDKSFIVDEITENIFIFVTLSANDLSKLDKWANVIDFVKTSSQYKAKDCISLSNRAIFKYMDMLDVIKKTKK
jgi:hypothetical protein